MNKVHDEDLRAAIAIMGQIPKERDQRLLSIWKVMLSSCCPDLFYIWKEGANVAEKRKALLLLEKAHVLFSLYGGKN